MSTNGSGYVAITKFDDLIGKTFAAVTVTNGNEEMRFLLPDGTGWRFYYEYECCASCSIVDIVGNLADIVGLPIVVAEEISSGDAKPPEDAESYTWTFYRFATVKGTVTVRWLGESNGYYSESVTFEKFV